ncbi:MAG: hypothetical protein AABX03_05020 [Nanoarchaeota archaeon]
MEITPKMMEAYGKLRAYDESLSMAIRCNNPSEIISTANQLLRFRIPEFRQVVPEEVRESLSQGNYKSLTRLETSAREEVDRHSIVNLAGLNRIRA